MLDGVLCTCWGCGHDVPFGSILSHMPEGHMVHVPWECDGCGEGGCYHMTRTDWDAVLDSVTREELRMGFQTRDERTVVRFVRELDEVETLDDLELLWVK